MKTTLNPWRYTLATLRLDLLWLPAVAWVLFALITWLKQGESQVTQVAGGYIGFALPLMAGVLASSAILDNRALELHFASPHPAWRALCERLAIILAIVALSALAFQVYLQLIGVSLSSLGAFFQRQIVWLLPSLTMMGLGSAGAFLLRQSTGGALAVGLIWILQLIGHDWFLDGEIRSCLFVFLGAYRPDHPALLVNQIVLTTLTILLFLSAWALYLKRERYL